MVHDDVVVIFPDFDFLCFFFVLFLGYVGTAVPNGYIHIRYIPFGIPSRFFIHDLKMPTFL